MAKKKRALDFQKGRRASLIEAVRCRTVFGMTEMNTKGAEEARNQLPELLAAAEKGRTTVITRYGRPIAAIVPIEALKGGGQRKPASLLSLRGSGRGMWGEDSTRTIRELRDEWER